MNKIFGLLVMLISPASLYSMDSTPLCSGHPAVSVGLFIEASAKLEALCEDRKLVEGQRTGKEFKLAPMTLSQLYYRFSHDLGLLPEIAQHILSLQCGDVTFEKIKQSSKSPQLLVMYIETLIPVCGYLLASELCECFFAHEKISICDIKDVHKQTSLHWTNNPKVVQILLRVVGDNAFKLLISQDDNGWTALHMAVYFSRIEIAKLVLNAADKKAQDLIILQTQNGKTALDYVLDYANAEVKEVMQSYIVNSTSI